MSTWNPQANDILLRALALTAAGERQEYLDGACQDDAALRADVEALLAAAHQAGSFLESPAVAPVLFATVEQPIAERPGTMIGPYKLLEQIGEGGFGVVFMAEQTRPVRRRVALKVLKPGMDTRQVVARFEAERQALAIMDHPNIAQVHDGGATPSGRPYFVMELVKGVPITEFCDQNQLTPRQRLELFVHVCQAVQHAHQKGIIHRDLKPSNILVVMHDTTPVVKVIDFGVAKALGQELTDKTLFTGFAQMVGTPLYMSPEQAGQSGLDVDTRSDIYSLGVLLYELLTGTTPFTKERFRAAGYDEIRRIIREEEPPKPSTRISTLGQAASTVSTNRKTDAKHLGRLLRGEVDWIVMRCLEKDRNRRYETANGLARDIERYLHDEPVHACPPSVAYRLRKFARRNQAVLTTMVLVTAALLTTVVVLVFSNLSISREEQEKSAALVAKDAALKQSEANLALILTALDEVYITEAEQRLALYRNEPNKPAEVQDPRQAQVERDFLQKGMVFYEKLIQPGNAEPAARFQTGKAYRRVGILQRELKQYNKAADSLSKAISLLHRLAADFPTEHPYRSELAEAYRWQGLLWGFTEEVRQPQEAEKAYRLATALADQLAAEFPTNPEYRMEAATYHMEFGRNLWFLEQLESADAEYLQAAKLWRELVADFPKERWYRHEFAYALDSLGWFWQESAIQPEKAEPFFREALKHHERLVAEDPSADNRARLARTQQHLVQILTSTGRSSHPEEAHRAAMDVLEKLAAEFPENAEYQATLLGNYDTLVQILTSAGEEQSAQEIYQRALKYYETLVAAHQRDAGPRDGLARSQHNLAGLLHKVGRKKEAAAAYREAIAIWEKLANDFPSNVEYSLHLAYGYGQLASVLNEDGQPEEAIKAWQQQVRSHEANVPRVPERADIREQLRHAYHSLGTTHRSRGQHEEAVTSFVQAAAVTEKLACDFPGNVWYFDRLRDAHNDLALTFIWARRCGEGEKFYGEAIELQPNDAMLWFRRAEFYARLGLWDLAAKDSSAAFKLQPLPTPLQCYARALLSVYTGDLDSYRQLCELLPNRFPIYMGNGASENTLARTSTIATSAQANAIAWTLKRAEAGAKHAAPWNYYALGLAYCRAGNFEQAVKELERCLAADTAWDATDLAYPVLAIAYHQLGKRQSAEAALEKAGGMIDRGLDVLARGPAGTQPTPWWENWLQSYLHYREAKTLIDGSPPAEDPRCHLARALAFAALGDEKKASDSYAKAAEQVELLFEALGEAPFDPSRLLTLTNVCHELAGILKKQGRVEETKKLCRRVAQAGRLTPETLPVGNSKATYANLAYALESLARLLDELDETGDAEACCREANAIWRELVADVNSEDHGSHLAINYDLLGGLLWRRGRTEEAVESYRAARAIWQKLVAESNLEDRRNHLAWTNEWLGNVHDTAGRPDDAAAAYREAAGLWEKLATDFPQNAAYRDHHFNRLNALANLYVKYGRLEEADQVLTKAVEESPHQPAAWRNRGELSARWGLLPEAAADLAHAYVLQEPGDSVQFFVHALLRAYVGDAAGYRKACAQMLARFVNSTSPDDWNNVAAALGISADSGVEPSRAVAFAGRAVGENRIVWRVAYLGMAYYRAGEFQRAAAALDESLTINANFNPTWVYSALAMARHQLGNSEEAAAALVKARSARDERTAALLADGVGHWPGGPWWDTVYAERLYQEAHTLVHGSPPPDDPRWIVLRGRALESIGRAEAARAAFAEAFALAPDDLMIRIQTLPPVSRADAYAQALAELHAFWKEHPRQPPATVLALAQVQQRWGTQQAHSGRYPAAAEALGDAAASYENLLAQIVEHAESTTNVGVPATAKDIAWYRHEMGFVVTFGGAALRKLGRLSEAETALARGLEIHASLVNVAEAPTDTKSRLVWNQIELGMVFQARGLTRQAEQKYREAIAHLEEQGKADYWLGGSYDALAQLCESQGRTAEALEAQRKAVAAWEKLASETKQPDNRLHQAWANERLAALLLGANEHAAAMDAYQRAVAVLEALVQEQPDNANLYFSSARLHTEFASSLAGVAASTDANKAFREAIVAYTKAIELAPTNPVLHNNLAWLYATCPETELRDPAQAVALAKKAVELRPTEGSGWNTLGAAQYRAGEWNAAVESLTKSMELRSGGDAEDWYFLAMAHCRLGHLDDARKWHQQAIEWVEKNAPLLAGNRQVADELRRFRAEAEEVLGIEP